VTTSTRRAIAVGLLALLAGLLVVGSATLISRGNGNAPVQVLVPTPGAPSGEPTGVVAASPSGPADTELKVYISGAVTTPGVYTMPEGARLVDAVAAAGGATAEADLAVVNLARRVRDEGHYHIPRVGETPRAGPGTEDDLGLLPASPNSQQSVRPINLNTASVDLLVTLPGIGRVKAKAIVDYRQRNGPFKSVEEIINVPGIGPSTYELVQSLVTVSGTQ